MGERKLCPYTIIGKFIITLVKLQIKKDNLDKLLFEVNVSNIIILEGNVEWNLMFIIWF